MGNPECFIQQSQNLAYIRDTILFRSDMFNCGDALKQSLDKCRYCSYYYHFGSKLSETA